MLEEYFGRSRQMWIDRIVEGLRSLDCRNWENDGSGKEWRRGCCSDDIVFLRVLKIKSKNQICGLKLPREPYRSSRLMQLTGSWQYDGII